MSPAQDAGIGIQSLLQTYQIQISAQSVQHININIQQLYENQDRPSP